MGKSVNQNSTDAALSYIKDAVERLVVCSGEPADYAAVSGVALADVAFTSTDVTIGDGASGRQYTTASKSGIAVDTNGTATHVALVDDTGTELLDVTTITSTQITTSGTVDVGSFSRTIEDVT